MERIEKDRKNGCVVFFSLNDTALVSLGGQKTSLTKSIEDKEKTGKPDD